MSDHYYIISKKQKINGKREGFQYENGGRFEFRLKEYLAAICPICTGDCPHIGADSGIHIAGSAMESLRSLV